MNLDQQLLLDDVRYCSPAGGSDLLDQVLVGDVVEADPVYNLQEDRIQ